MKRGDVLRRLNWTAAQLDRAVDAASDRVIRKSESTGGRPTDVLLMGPTAQVAPVDGTKGTKAPADTSEATLVPLVVSPQVEAVGAESVLGEASIWEVEVE